MASAWVYEKVKNLIFAEVARTRTKIIIPRNIVLYITLRGNIIARMIIAQSIINCVPRLGDS